MRYDTLIEPAVLQEHLDDPTWVVVDCRFNLADPDAGRQRYEQGHIPGAYYAHLDEDLADPVTPDSGRHPLPDPQVFAGKLGRWGVSENSQVVTYDDVGGAMAARLWWLLRWVGHRDGAVLNGGLQAWDAQMLPLSSELPEPHSGFYPVQHPDTLAWVDTAYVLANIEQRHDLLIDARAAARFRGEAEPIDSVAGHVPGAVNLPLEGNLDDRKRFLDTGALKQRFLKVLGDRSPACVVHMCGSGVTACHNLLAMEAAGLPGSRLYAGSWSEWIRNPARPVAAGSE